MSQLNSNFSFKSPKEVTPEDFTKLITGAAVLGREAGQNGVSDEAFAKAVSGYASEILKAYGLQPND